MQTAIHFVTCNDVNYIIIGYLYHDDCNAFSILFVNKFVTVQFFFFFCFSEFLAMESNDKFWRFVDAVASLDSAEYAAASECLNQPLGPVLGLPATQ